MLATLSTLLFSTEMATSNKNKYIYIYIYILESFGRAFARPRLAPDLSLQHSGTAQKILLLNAAANTTLVETKLLELPRNPLYHSEQAHTRAIHFLFYVATVLLPSLAPYLPGGHLRQPDCFVSSVYLPSLQFIHFVACSSAKRPTSQLKQV